jgi:hypothetical protein
MTRIPGLGAHRQIPRFGRSGGTWLLR